MPLINPDGYEYTWVLLNFLDIINYIIINYILI